MLSIATFRLQSSKVAKTLSRMNLNQKGNTSPSAVWGNLDGLPIHIRPIPHQRVQRMRIQWVQAITARRLSHHNFSIATDFGAESVKSQVARDLGRLATIMGQTVPTQLQSMRS